MEGDGSGSVREGVGGKNNGLQRVCEWTPVRVGAGTRHRGTKVQARRIQGRIKKWGVFGFKQGKVATFGCNVAMFQRGKRPTSRR